MKKLEVLSRYSQADICNWERMFEPFITKKKKKTIPFENFNKYHCLQLFISTINNIYTTHWP